MQTYDVPTVGRVTVSIDTHSFGNSDAVLKSLDDVRLENGQLATQDVWDTVNQYLRSIGVVN